MNRVARALAAAAVMTAAWWPSLAHGQSSTVAHYNVAAGATFPLSDFGGRNQTGYNVLLGIGMAQRGSPLGFRAEGLYNEFAYNCDGFDSNCTGTSRVAGLTGNVTYDVPIATGGMSNALYLIGGIGWYNTRDRFSLTSLNNVGFNGGAGFRFPLAGFSAYVEARYHSVQNADISFAPISFGLLF